MFWIVTGGPRALQIKAVNRTLAIDCARTILAGPVERYPSRGAWYAARAKWELVAELHAPKQIKNVPVGERVPLARGAGRETTI